MGALADYVSLAKPRITALVAFTTASGLWLAPIRPSPGIIVVTLLGTVLAVASANVLNMYLERETDALEGAILMAQRNSAALEKKD